MPRRQRLTSLVIMGVAGSGKSTLLAALEQRLGWPWLEGDSLHPPANVSKMAAGRPLTDDDRWPWLARVARWIGDREAERTSSLATCSALRRRYRDVIRQGHPSVWFVHLDPDPQVLAARIGARTGHFMPGSMLDSQLDALEPLAADEPGTTMQALAGPDELADQIVELLRLEPVTGR